jgi:glycine/serine hydroxymethyltransferase
MKHIARLIVRVLSHLGEDRVYQEVREEVEGLSLSFPVPGLDE